MESLGPIEKNVKISHKVVEQFKKLIYEGRLRPGEQLAPEKDLAKALQVSRPTLREALNVLEAMGFIEIRPREGSRVRPVIPPPLGESVVTMLKDNPDIVFELFEVRKRIDAEGAALAAERASEADLLALREYLEKIQQVQARGESLLAEEPAKVYVKTFFRIGEATHNTFYAHIMRSVWSLVEGAFPYSREKLSFVPHVSRRLFGQYEEIINAVLEHKPNKARQAVVRHIDFVEAELRRVLEAESKEESGNGMKAKAAVS